MITKANTVARYRSLQIGPQAFIEALNWSLTKDSIAIDTNKMGKKKYIFLVCLELVELSNVALRNEFIFVKIRQKNSGKLNYLSQKSEVREHKVVWNEKINFKCKAQANASTGILNACYLRFSVRKETRLGGTYKLGFVDVNLSEFAGCGKQSGKYLLEGYTSLTRLDNSILKFFIDMQLISGDPLFKRHMNTTEEAFMNEQQLLSSMSSQHFPPLNLNAHHHSHHFVTDTMRHSLSIKTPFIDENKLTDSTRVNNDVAVNEIIEQNLRYASSLPATHKGLSLHDLQ